MNQYFKKTISIFLSAMMLFTLVSIGFVVPVFAADTTALDAAIADANALTASDYVDFSGVTAAVNAAADTTEKTQTEIDDMEDAIRVAMAKLELITKPNTTPVPDGYTPIYTASDLSNIQNDLAGSYILMNDIVCDSSYTLITGKFTGILDGNGFVISGINVSGSQTRGPSYNGFFRETDGAQIRNLGFMNCTFYAQSTNSGSKVGMIVGRAANTTIENCLVENCQVKAVHESNDAFCGSITGEIYNYTEVRNCVARYNTLTGKATGCIAYVGGLFGSVATDTTVENCLVQSCTLKVDGNTASYWRYTLTGRAQGGTVSGIFSNMTQGWGKGSFTSITNSQNNIELTDQDTFVDWDFDDVWYMTETNPELQVFRHDYSPIRDAMATPLAAKSCYTEASYTAYKEALAAAGPVLNNLGATKTEIADAASSLNDAIANLQSPITINANGGTVSPETIDVTFGSNTTAVFPASDVTATRAGYYPAGWDKDTVTFNDTVTALWTLLDYTITLNAAGGSVEETVIPYTTESTETLPEPAKTGYDFAGWQPDTTSGSWISGQNYAADTSLTGKYGDVSLTAQWTPVTYTVTYDGNNASSGSTVSSTHIYDVSSALTVNGYSREYTVDYDYQYRDANNIRVTGSDTATAAFNGWATSADGEKVYDDGQIVLNLRNTAGTFPLFANWTLGTVTLPDDPRSGYQFGGWFTDVDCTQGQQPGGAQITPTADITYYAKWTPNTYKVHFNGNGATSGEMVDQDFTYDVPQALTANAFKKEYTVTYDHNGGSGTDSDTASAAFYGWALSANGGVVYWNNESVSNLTATQNGTANLYVVWNDMGSVTLPDSPMTGYTFNGWYSDEGLNNKVGSAGDSYTPAANGVTLYAKHTINSYTITFKGADGTVLDTQTVEHGLTPLAPTIPGKTATDEVHYNGDWNTPVVAAMGPATYTVVYTPEAHYGGTATCTAQANCDVCGKAYGEPMGHDMTGTAANGATCTQPGNTAYWYCSRCEKYFSDENGDTQINADSWVIPANGHTYAEPAAEDWTWTRDGDTFTAAVSVTCTSNDDTRTLTASVELSEDVAATPDGDGHKTFTATATVGEGDGQQTFTATKTLDFYYVSVTPGTGVSVTGAQTGSYEAGTVLTVSAAAQTGYDKSTPILYVDGDETANGSEIVISCPTAITTNDLTKNTYTVTWEDQWGTVINSTTVEHGWSPVMPIDDPGDVRIEDKVYTFDHWSNGLTAGQSISVTEDLTITAYYALTEAPAKYTVTFLNDDNYTVISTAEYEWQETVVVPDAPVSTNRTISQDYTFLGWTPEVAENVTADATYVATFETEPHTRVYHVKWVYGPEHSNVAKEADLPYDTIFSASDIPADVFEKDDQVTHNTYSWAERVGTALADHIGYSTTEAVIVATLGIDRHVGTPAYEWVGSDEAGYTRCIATLTCADCGEELRVEYTITDIYTHQGENCQDQTYTTYRAWLSGSGANSYFENQSKTVYGGYGDHYYPYDSLRFVWNTDDPANVTCTAQQTCYYCGHVDEEPGTVNVYSKTDATCAAPEITVYNASFEHWTDQRSDAIETAPIDPTAHKYDGWTVRPDDARCTRPTENGDGTWTKGTLVIPCCNTYTLDYGYDPDTGDMTVTFNYTVADYADHDMVLTDLDRADYDAFDEAYAKLQEIGTLDIADDTVVTTYEDYDWQTGEPVTVDVTFAEFKAQYLDMIAARAEAFPQNLVTIPEGAEGHGFDEQPRVDEMTAQMQYALGMIYDGEGNVKDGLLNTYTVTFTQKDGTVTTYADKVKGDVVDVPAAPATVDGFAFLGWTANGDSIALDIDAATYTVEGNAAFTAKYAATANVYEITWLNEDGSPIGTTNVEHGTVPTHADAGKAADALYTYTFAGWDPDPVAATQAASYTATFTKEYNADVQDLIDTAAAIVSDAEDTTTGDDYDAAYIGALQEQLDILDDAKEPVATDEQKTAAVTALAGLVNDKNDNILVTVDTAALGALIGGKQTEHDNADASVYTAESIAALQTAIDEAQAVLEANAGTYKAPEAAEKQSAVNAAYNTLNGVSLVENSFFTVTFYDAQNEEITHVTVAAGTTLTDEQIPAIPEKAADETNHYTGAWDTEIVRTVTADADYTIVYTGEAHAWGWEIDDEPTCGEPGSKHEECTVCHATRSENTVEPATGEHAWGWEIDDAPTCGEPGSKHEECSVCHATQSENTVIPAKGHTPGAAVKEHETAATCTEAGSYENVVYCSVCGDEISRTAVTDPAKGHTWGSWTVIRPATEEDEGEAERVCAACGATETKTAAELEPITMTVRFVNISRMHYIIDLGDDETYSVYNSSTVDWTSTGPLKFRVAVYGTFMFEDISIYADGEELVPDEDGVYTLPNNGGTVVVTAAGAVQDDSAPNGKLSFWELLIRFFRSIVAFFSSMFGKNN